MVQKKLVVAGVVCWITVIICNVILFLSLAKNQQDVGNSNTNIGNTNIAATQISVNQPISQGRHDDDSELRTQIEELNQAVKEWQSRFEQAIKNQQQQQQQQQQHKQPEKPYLRTLEEKEADEWIGFGYVQTWKDNEKTYCSPTNQQGGTTAKSGSDLPPSTVTCWSHPRNGQKASFCSIENAMIDFDKITPMKHTQEEMYDFAKGAVKGNCELSPDFVVDEHNGFRDSIKQIMGSFEAIDGSGKAVNGQCAEWVEHPVYFVTRYEYANAYHIMTDYFNAYLASLVTGIPVEEWEVAFLDYHPLADTLDPAWEEIFSPNHKLMRGPMYMERQKKARGPICFRRAIFSLPGYQSLLSMDIGRGNPYFDGELIRGFKNFVLNAYGLLDRAPPSKPSITFIFRRDYVAHPRNPSGKINRKIANENQVLQALSQGRDVKVQGADFAKLSFRQQVELMQDTNILMGVHGAGLSLLLFLPDEAVVIEYPDGANLHFRNFSKWRGLPYMTCGSGYGRPEFITIDIAAMERCVDGAVKIARNFGRSTGDCGLRC